MRRFLAPSVLVCVLAAALPGCSVGQADGPLDVAIIGEPDDLFQTGVRLSPAAQHLRAATNEGLVALDPSGQVIPAIAERWIVTDDGLSYIFRMRDSAWPDGEPITGRDVQLALQDSINQLEGTSLGLDLGKIIEVRAMTGRVVELRLASPMPDLLRLLAQPEMGLVRRGSGTGPMIVSRDEESDLARLNAIAPEERGLPAREDWADAARAMTVRALPPSEAIAAFADGEIDLLLGGTLATLPMVRLGPLSRGTIQVDPALGLFGLAILSEEGVLADPARREALSMAIDRPAIIQPFNLGGWQASTWTVPPSLFDPAQYPASRWDELDLEERRALATRRIAAWEAESGEQAELRIRLPQGPGSDRLFEGIAAAFSAIGVTAVQVGPGEPAQLALVDRIARYASPRWFLNQFNCTLEVGLCSPEADRLVRASVAETDPAAKIALLAEAHGVLTEREAFIPLGAPVRWSLVRGAVNGYQPNPWGLHPLFPLSQPTT